MAVAGGEVIEKLDDMIVRTMFNPDYRQGSMVTLWTMREHLDANVLLMDAERFGSASLK